MSDFTHLDVRPEVQNCLRSCMYLLDLAATAENHPFSEDEQQLVTFYVRGLRQMIDRLDKM